MKTKEVNLAYDFFRANIKQLFGTSAPRLSLLPKPGDVPQIRIVLQRAADVEKLKTVLRAELDRIGINGEDALRNNVKILKATKTHFLV